MPRHVQVYLVRHGETNENRLGILQGQLDTKLNETGIQQAELAALTLTDVPFTHAFSSNLTRAVDTARILLRHHPDLELRVDVGLCERGFGSAEGKAWKRGSKLTADIEPLADFRARMLYFWDHTIASTRHDGSDNATLLVVSHGSYLSNLIRVLIEHRGCTRLAGVKLGPWVNTAIATIDVSRDSGLPVITGFRNTAQLGQASGAVQNVDEIAA